MARRGATVCGPPVRCGINATRLASAAQYLHNAILPSSSAIAAIMTYTSIYFVPGLAIVLVMLWDYTRFTVTAKRLAKPAQEKGSQFSRIAREVRNLTVMALCGFFLWPWVVWMELFGNGKK